MLWTIFFVLVVLWALGMFTATMLGGFIHLSLLVAAAILMIQIFKNQKPLDL